MNPTKIDNFSEAFAKYECQKDVVKAAEKGRELYEPKPFAVEFLGAYKVASVGALVAGVASIALGYAYVAAQLSEALGIPAWAGGVLGAILMLALEACKGFALSKAAKGILARENTLYIAVFLVGALVAVGGSFTAATRGADVAAVAMVESHRQHTEQAATEAADKARQAALTVVRDLESERKAHFEATSWKGKLSAKNQRLYNNLTERITEAKAQAEVVATEAADKARHGLVGKATRVERSGGFIWWLSAGVELSIVCCFLFAAYYTYRTYIEAGLTGFEVVYHNPTTSAPQATTGSAKGLQDNPHTDYHTEQPPRQTQSIGFAVGGSIQSMPGSTSKPHHGYYSQLSPNVPTVGRKPDSGHQKASDSAEGAAGSAYYWEHYPDLCKQVVAKLDGESSATWRQVAQAARVSESTTYRCRIALTHELSTKP